jgi:hypothetical protein
LKYTDSGRHLAQMNIINCFPTWCIDAKF